MGVMAFVAQEGEGGEEGSQNYSIACFFTRPLCNAVVGVVVSHRSRRVRRFVARASCLGPPPKTLETILTRFVCR